MKKQFSAYTTKMLLWSSLFAISLSVTRVWITESMAYVFLNWNLFLAMVPFFMVLVLEKQITKSRWAYICVSALWLLFFPNAPYILTDLIHLRYAGAAPVWYDLLLILSYAWAGLMLGFVSLRKLEDIYLYHFPNRLLGSVTTIVLFLSAFGVYLGRFLRWNSWDVIQSPLRLLGDLGDRFLYPLDHPRTWAITLILGLFLNLVYRWNFKMVRSL